MTDRWARRRWKAWGRLSARRRWQITQALAWRLRQDTRPIVIGPYRSEAGFEFLYWIPFLQRIAASVPHFWDRAIVLTRGGAAALYPPHGQSIQGRPADLYVLRSVPELARENIYDSLSSRLQKQVWVTDWDRTVVREVCAALGVRRWHLLHPSWMYWALSPWWDEQAGLGHLLALADYTPLTPPPLPPELTLPPRFVVMKWYTRPVTFPVTPQTIDAVRLITGIVAAQTPVVLVRSDTAGDDHADLALTGPNITVVSPQTPADSLALQAAIIGRATAFVGTYGGLAQLALRMKIPSCSVWQTFGGTAHAHFSLSVYLSRAHQTPFLTGSLDDVGLWRQMVVAPAVRAVPTEAVHAG